MKLPLVILEQKTQEMQETLSSIAGCSTVICACFTLKYLQVRTKFKPLEQLPDLFILTIPLVCAFLYLCV